MKTEKICGVGGRPRSFCIDNALDKALEVFWRKGYDGTSLTDLTEAMGINRPSLYAAYGNKEELFLKVLDRYAEVYGAFLPEAMKEPTARLVVEKLLKTGLAGMADPCRPRGCLGVQGALSCSDSADFVKQELISRRDLTRKMIAERFHQAKAEGDLPPHSDPDGLAFFVATFMHGVSVQMTSNASIEDLEKAIEVALHAFDVAVVN